MKKSIVALIIASVIILFCGAFTFGPITPVIDITTNVPSFNVEKNSKFVDDNLENYSRSELKNLITEYQQIQIDAHTLAESARSLGWPESSTPIQMAQAEHWNAKLAIEVYQNRLDELNAEWESKAAEYPEATQIWLYMKDLGWNDYVCAGIMGNLMAEVGGQTLALQVSAKSNSYYGICQWNKAYSNVWNTDLETQCNFLRDTIQYEIDTFGYAYSKGFDFESFLELTNEKQAAKAFAVCYERCGSGTYKTRQTNATAAYNYFVN